MRSSTQAWDLQRPGAVLLLSCYELGHQPQALANATAFLQRAGVHPVVVDVAVRALRDEQIDAAAFVAVSVPMHTALQIGRRLAQRIRQRNPDCTIAFFGHSAHLHADVLLTHDADLVLGGEVEAQLVSAICASAAGEPPQRQAHLLRSLDFPLPARQDLSPLGDYARLDWRGEQRLAGHLETTRGCRHRCRHCPLPAVYDGRLFAVRKDVVLADARQQIAAGARHLSFGDPDFLNAPGQGIPILERIHDEFPQVTFDFTARIEHLVRHAELLPSLGARGVLFVVSAVEILNDSILAILDKGHTQEDVLRAQKVLRQAGIALRPSLMPFTPWTNWQDVQDLLQWVVQTDLIDNVDAVQYSIRLLVPRGSLLLQHPEIQPHLGPLDEAALTFSWTHRDASLDVLQRDLARIAERAAQRQEEPHATFERIVQRVFDEAPRRHRRALAVPGEEPRRRRQRPPRMTEPWFC